MKTIAPPARPARSARSARGRTSASRVLILVGPEYEDLEVWYPKLRLEEAGYETKLAGMGEREYRGKHGYPCVVDGRRLTSTVGIRDDVANAGAEWVDAPTVIDGNIVSSRVPKDLPAFAKAMLEVLAKQA